MHMVLYPKPLLEEGATLFKLVFAKKIRSNLLSLMLLGVVKSGINFD